ncbi:GNAT family N-acetyltransferase [Amorphus orientalis]|uniref:Acetyltransferase n=1 Tax=Amorphus orientalis TaxID=649198 RepID=A0AAE4ASW9_9HYPH|nr:GNAT family N-acetyltransferase [Amorphus orientalis]MDQ0314414.1 putative acetyltransferase [Amorphus orientalis]
MQIRPGTRADTPVLAAVFTESIHGLGPQRYTKDQLTAWAPLEPDLALWHERLEGLDILVAEEADQVAGFTGFTAQGYINFLFVRSDFARRGIARALLRAAEARATAAGAAMLTTEASLVARPAFESEGYEVVEEQVVERGGVELIRFAMRKPLVPVKG